METYTKHLDLFLDDEYCTVCGTALPVDRMIESIIICEDCEAELAAHKDIDDYDTSK